MYIPQELATAVARVIRGAQTDGPSQLDPQEISCGSKTESGVQICLPSGYPLSRLTGPSGGLRASSTLILPQLPTGWQLYMVTEVGKQMRCMIMLRFS